MDKPLSIKRVDFMQRLAGVINESGLPAFIIADCLTITLSQIRELAEKQLAIDAEEYNKSLEMEE